MISEIPTQGKPLEPYVGVVEDDVVEDILYFAQELRGLRIAHFNSTAQGGGVAEILKSLTPLMRGVGLDTRWFVLTPKRAPGFFSATKHIHNLLQGSPGGLTSEEKLVYLETVEETASNMVPEAQADVWVVHDPQLLPLVTSVDGLAPQTSFWVCHIDLSHPNKDVLAELMPLTAPYNGLVFSSASYVPAGLNGIPVSIIPPTIDPLVPKNIPMDLKEAQGIMERLGLDTSRPVVTQVSRFDLWKDPIGVIEAYKMAKQEVPDLQLVLMGVIEAQDDPEAKLVLQEVQDLSAGDPSIHLVWDPTTLPDQIDRVVNALQTGSDVILQKSTREGFGLTVTEAMWKGAAVVGGNVGGIRLQIQDGVNGFLVNSPEQCAQRMVELLRNRGLRQDIGKAARESVRSRFLLPRLMRDYLKLIYNQLHNTK